MGLGTQKAPEAARPLPLPYSSASDFQFRYAPVTVILGYNRMLGENGPTSPRFSIVPPPGSKCDAWWQNKKALGASAPGALNKLWLFIFKKSRTWFYSSFYTIKHKYSLLRDFSCGKFCDFNNYSYLCSVSPRQAS